ncbi:MAG: squalene--hopene cyclase [Bryobacteraceae bacterium]|jgi:squalene-hopene/tetraprenyl-beta-curcumene cyclase
MSGFGLTRAAEVRPFQSATATRAAEDSETAVSRAIHSAAQALSDRQHPDGYWCGDLTADSTLESDYILLQLWLHRPEGSLWNPPARGRIERCCRAILERQLPDGGWNIYPNGPSEVNASAKAYSALRIAGVEANSPEVLRARARILELGGLQACNSYVRINLSLFGLYPRRRVPTVPPEIMLLPGDILYEMSSWTRAIVVPLSIVQAMGRQRPAPEGLSLDELLAPGKRLSLGRRDGLAILFHHLDRLLKIWERTAPRDIRAAAIREAEHWIVDRTRNSDGLGAIYPAMMYQIMAFDSLGYPGDHPDLIEAIRHFENLPIEREDRFCFQPCFSPAWDTAIAAFALGEAGLADPAALTRAADWLIRKEVRRRGDWSVKRPNLEPSGWAFEFANEHYPDIDDTAMVLLALCHARASDAAAQQRCTGRALKWLLGMQSRDGGWAAFDVDNNWTILNRVPFADHNAMLDPTCPDITGRVLDALARHGLTHGHPAVDSAVRYLLKHQNSDGCWYGRWGVNYVYGTFLALRGLCASGAPGGRAAVKRGAEWLRSVQSPDGGWGESCAGYQAKHFVAAPSTPSQTAWALLGLAAAGDRTSAAAARGVRYLLDTQLPDGTWQEHLATGTGFPGVFFLSYHLYRQYFPLLALASCRTANS